MRKHKDSSEAENTNTKNVATFPDYISQRLTVVDR